MPIIGPATPETNALIEAMRTLCAGHEGEDVRSAVVNMLAIVAEWAIATPGAAGLEHVHAEIQACCDEAKGIATINADAIDANPAND